MKINIKKLVPITSLFMLFVQICLAQSDYRPGYYITWEDDTIHGLIDYRGALRSSHSCSFKKNETASQENFSPQDIKAFRFINSKFYISKKLPAGEDKAEEQVFLEFLVDGITNLYYYKEKLHGDNYLLEDKSGNLYTLNNSESVQYVEGKGHILFQDFEYIGLLKATFADCMEIQPELEGALLQHNSLITLTKKYHDYICGDEQCIVYEKPLAKVKTRMAFSAGFGTQSLSFDRGLFSGFAIGREPGYQLGLIFSNSFPGMNEKLSIDIGFDFQKVHFQGYQEYRSDIENLNYAFDINSLAVNPSAILKYVYPRGKIRPELGAGLYSSFFVFKDEQIDAEKLYPEWVYVKEITDTPLPGLIAGLVFQTGVNVEINNNELFYHVKYYKLRSLKNPKRDDNYARAFMETFLFSAGFYLR